MLRQLHRAQIFWSWVIQHCDAIGRLLHYTKNSLSSPCTSQHKHEQKDKTKTLVKFPDYVFIDFGGGEGSISTGYIMQSFHEYYFSCPIPPPGGSTDYMFTYSLFFILYPNKGWMSKQKRVITSITCHCAGTLHKNELNYINHEVLHEAFYTYNFCCKFQCDFPSQVDVNEMLRVYDSSPNIHRKAKMQ